ncbi:hypothetical protein [uncultured Brachyspira sp.]|nr:hypothetical protein [uncultured Brachyspira sp.]
MTKFLNFLDNDYTFYLLDEEEYILLINEYNDLINYCVEDREY